MANLELNGIDHFAIFVTDLATSAEWYERVLGLSVLHRWQTTWMVGRGNIKIGLFQRPEATPLADPDTKLIIAHIAFAVDADKLEDARRTLIDRGVQLEGPDDSGIADSYFFKDPDGHELEITAYHAAR